MAGLGFDLVFGLGAGGDKVNLTPDSMYQKNAQYGLAVLGKVKKVFK